VAQAGRFWQALACLVPTAPGAGAPRNGLGHLPLGVGFAVGNRLYHLG